MVARSQTLLRVKLLAPAQRGSKHKNQVLAINPNSQPVLRKDGEQKRGRVQTATLEILGGVIDFRWISYQLAKGGNSGQILDKLALQDKMRNAM